MTAALAIQWGDVSHAGAFFLGTLFGVILTIRLARLLLDMGRRERERDR